MDSVAGTTRVTPTVRRYISHKRSAGRDRMVLSMVAWIASSTAVWHSPFTSLAPSRSTVMAMAAYITGTAELAVVRSPSLANAKVATETRGRRVAMRGMAKARLLRKHPASRRTNRRGSARRSKGRRRRMQCLGSSSGGTLHLDHVFLHGD